MIKTQKNQLKHYKIGCLLIDPKYSSIKLGKPNEEAKYSMITWFSMLFSAAYGVGLYFYGVAETVLHFRDSVEGYNRYSYLIYHGFMVDLLD